MPHAPRSLWSSALVLALLAPAAAPAQDGAPQNAPPSLLRAPPPPPTTSSSPQAPAPPKPTTTVLGGPVVAADAEFSADRITAWQTDPRTRWLRLDSEFSFRLGAYGFRGSAALVRIQTETRPGKTIRHLALVIQQARPLRGAGSPLTARAQRLLVTADTTGQLAIRTDLFTPAPSAPGDGLTRAGMERIVGYDQKLARALLPNKAGASAVAKVYDQAVFDKRDKRRQQIAQSQRSLSAIAAADQPPAEPERQAPPPAETGVLPTQGVVRVNADRIVYQQGEDENALLLIGDVRLLYQGFGATGDSAIPQRTLTLQAERAVLLLKKDASGGASGDGGNPGSRLDAGSVRGVYLEDNAVVTAGDYSVRAPRVFYDLTRNRAVLLKAVLYTYDVDRRVPLYLRAQRLEQTSATSFSAKGATLTTSEFAQPHFAIRANKLSFAQQPGKGDQPTTASFAASGTTLNAQGIPFFYWPYLGGKGREVPLRRVQAGYDSDDGFQLRTRWDAFALVGQPRPRGVDLAADIDYRGRRGAGLGLDLDYDTDSALGNARGYLLTDDRGEDSIGGRDDIEHDGDTRGFVDLQHRQILPSGFELSGELGYVSDETFLEEFFPGQAYDEKPYEASLYLKKQEDEWALTALASVNPNEFTPQLVPLQQPGFTVERAPELGYHRTGTSLLGDRLTWYSQTTAGRIRADFGEDTPGDRGFDAAQSAALFGIAPNTSFEQAADAVDFPDSWVTRVDSRQEFSSPFTLGPIDVTPYATGRVTAYDKDFDDYNGGEDDNARLWGSVGTRFRTEISSTYDSVDSTVLNLHRLRHVIEPHADVFYADATLDSEDLPGYDFGVEPLAQGAGYRFGLTQTLQTQRGGPGRWRSVDWLKLTTDAVFRSDDADTSAEIARFYDYRPEYTTGGDHFYTQLMWMVSDTLGVTGELTHDFDDGRVVQWSLAATLDHTPRLSSFLRYDVIDALNSRLLSYGFVYQLTSKYRFRFAQRWDIDHGGSRSIDLALERQLPRWKLRVLASFDQIDDDQSIGVVLTPDGFGGSGLGSGGGGLLGG